LPRFNKAALSQFMKSECKRQIRMHLSRTSKDEIAAEGMPGPAPQRPGFADVTEAGNEWEDQKLTELREHFGAAVLGLGAYRPGPEGQVFRYSDTPLESLEMLPSATAGSFLAKPILLLEHADAPDGMTFARASGLHDLRVRFALELSHIVPDLIQVLPPGTFKQRVLPDGGVEELDGDDGRLQLRVVDIKMTSQPGASYFAEVTYYSMVLAGWLDDYASGDDGRPFSERFVVVPDAAVWPGSHERSPVTELARAAEREGRTAEPRELLAAWEGELEPTVFDAFRFRVLQIIREVLPEVLSTPWRDLPLHVTPSCRNCDYLGYPWLRKDGTQTWKPAHCWPSAVGTRHLSRIPRVSRAAAAALTDAGRGDIPALAMTDWQDPVFDGHQALKTSRAVLPRRAAALQGNTAGVVPDAGSSASMPKYADLKIFVTASFDVSSAITLSLGVSAAFRAQVFGRPDTLATRNFEAAVHTCDFRDVGTEYRAVSQFLRAIRDIMQAPEIGRFEADHGERCRMQVYMWDQITYEHICRVVGRHLPRLLQDNGIRNLVWLFPSEEVLRNPDDATRSSPITIVDGVVRTAVAVPVPHHYSLLEVARHYHPARITNIDAMVSVHPMFEDKLSDQIPSERAIEIWQRKPGWEATLANLLKAVRSHHTALSLIVERLERDLDLARKSLTAPYIHAGGAARTDKMSLDGHLLVTFARLNVAMEGLAKDEIRAMPPHEREARGKSARLLGRLPDADATTALARLGLRPKAGRRLYRLAPTSREVAMRDGDMGFAIAPVGDAHLLDMPFRSVADQHGIVVNLQSAEREWKMSDALAVTPVRVDREGGVLVLDENRMRAGILDEVEACGAADLSGEVMLDPVQTDHFTKQLAKVLLKVGRPREAANNPLVMRATGEAAVVPGRVSKSSPLSRFLWQADQMAAEVRQGPSLAVLQRLLEAGIGLNTSQHRAMTEALGHGVRLVWGPPGTGKSHTLAVTINAALLQAQADGRPLRVLVTAFTWSAIDNLLQPTFDHAANLLPDAVQFVRLTGRDQVPNLPDGFPDQMLLELNRHVPSDGIRQLRRKLTTPAAGDLVVVGATPGQTLNLIRAGHAKGEAFAEELFDVVVIDEGSQLDVARATLALTALAGPGHVICAGDPKQMAPIHKAEPPKGLEAMVGSVYGFLSEIHRVLEIQLTTNYRSSAAVVDCFRYAGYGPDLRAHSAGLRLRLKPPAEAFPAEWPSRVAWAPAYDDILDPARPVACLLHHDAVSAQSCEFEAQLAVSLVWRLWTRLVPGLEGRVSHAGALQDAAAPAPCEASDFWTERVGIVTPHRAQQSIVIAGLQALFGPLGHDPSMIRAAVDTVERFQGQERDVMLATYAVGDPDTITDEEEFLHSLNRFNVMASRARAKLVVVASHELVRHLADDIDVVRESRMLKHFAEAHCSYRQDITLPWRKPDGTEMIKDVSFRWA
jgi:hypothetical protein